MSLAMAARGAAPARAPSRATFVDVLEALGSGLVLLLMAETVLPHLAMGIEPSESTDVLRLLWPPAYALILIGVAARLSRFGSIWLAVALTAPILLLALASTQWSLVPDVTIRRAVALIFTSLFGFYLAARFSWRGLLELVAAVFVILALGSYLASLAVPSLGVHDDLHAGAWRGLWVQKNALGGTMVRGVLACLCAAALAPQRRVWWWAAALLCAGLVIASTSTTALLGLFVVVAGLMALAVVRKGGLGAVAMVWLVLLGLVAVGAVFAVAPEAFFEVVGKDATLTGRTDIWTSLLRAAAERPLLGYGYSGFWSAEQGPAAWVRAEVEWDVPSAHNGWLDTLIQLGWVGVAVLSLHFVVNLLAAGWRTWKGPEVYWALPSTLVLALFSVSESAFLEQNSMTWVLYVATFAKLLQDTAAPPGEARL